MRDSNLTLCRSCRVSMRASWGRADDGTTDDPGATVVSVFCALRHASHLRMSIGLWYRRVPELQQSSAAFSSTSSSSLSEAFVRGSNQW